MLSRRAICDKGETTGVTLSEITISARAMNRLTKGLERWIWTGRGGLAWVLDLEFVGGVISKSDDSCRIFDIG